MKSNIQIIHIINMKYYRILNRIQNRIRNRITYIFFPQLILHRIMLFLTPNLFLNMKDTIIIHNKTLINLKFESNSSFRWDSIYDSEVSCVVLLLRVFFFEQCPVCIYGLHSRRKEKTLKKDTNVIHHFSLKNDC